MNQAIAVMGGAARVASALLAAALALLTAACVTDGLVLESDPSAAKRTYTEYRLGAGDRIKITVFDEERLSGEFAVDGAGLISAPLVGEVPAAGKTVRELQRDLETAYKEKEILKTPQISAQMLNYRPYYMLGEVVKPGEYPYIDSLSVLNAVATAGGFTYRAQTRYVYITRADTSEERKFILTPDTQVEPGDTIRVGERLL